MRKIGSPGVLLSFGVLSCALLLPPTHLRAAEEQALTNPFFAFDNGVGRGRWTPKEQATVLKELGYAGIGYTGIENLPERLEAFEAQELAVFSLYVSCHPGREQPFSPALKDAVKQLEGTGAMLWLTVNGKTNDDHAARVVREIADMADAHGVKVALYPHHGFHVAKTADALRLIEKVDRDNVGVSINLCHELRAGKAAELDDLIEQAAPHLYLVSINGTDHEGGWDKLIQPLDSGEFDVRPFLMNLHAAGYRGPIGLQCYNVKGDQRENLKRSMAAWKELSSLTESEKERQ